MYPLWPLDGRPPQLINYAAAGVGTEFTVTVPANQFWNVLAVTAILTASAAAANRLAHIVIRPGSAQIIIHSSEPGAIIALAVVPVYWAQNIATGNITGPVGRLVSLPSPLIVNPGWQIETLTGNIDVGDQWSAGTIIAQVYQLPG
jgi:hypothetical protein